MCIRDSLKRVHNNCSGKHTAMLALAKHRGWSIEGYERDSHPVQQAMLNQVALWSGLSASQIEIAVDGCGAAVFGLPLESCLLYTSDAADERSSVDLGGRR